MPPPSAAPPRRRDASGRRWAHRVLLPIVAFLLLSGPVGCGSADDARERDGRPVVIASIFPLADLARSVGGEEIRVRTLLPAGASPATFDVTPRTIRAVADARLALLVGGGLDRWAEGLIRGASPARVVTLTRRFALRGEGEEEGTGNPHVWLDPVLVRDHLLPALTDALVELVPDEIRGIRERSLALADTLTALDAEIRSSLAGLERRRFVASHSAWVYFADRYQLEPVGVIHEHPGQEPSARALADLVRNARAADVRVVFREPQIADAAARALAGELGVPVLVLDPLGGEGVRGHDSYEDLMRYNTRQFVRGLGGPSSS